MIKFLHKPKIKNFIVFISMLLVIVSLNILFYFINNNLVTINVDTYLIMHCLLPLFVAAFFIMIIFYMMFTIEKLSTFLKVKRQITLLKVLQNVDIVLFILVFLGMAYIVYFTDDTFSSSSIMVVLFGDIKDSFYFQYFSKIGYYNDMNTLCFYWVCMVPTLFLFTLEIVLIMSAVRKSKIIKKAKEEIERYEYRINEKIRINELCGFVYEESEFYKQTQIPYFALNQKNGTRGEFEAYRVLINQGLRNAEYIFNREIPKNDGLSTEIDLIVVHKNGMIVLENKHYSTRIYGKATEHDLTIIDNTGRKRSIYNPILQNENHVKYLKEYLTSKQLYVDDIVTPIYSVVVFTDINNNDKSDDIISGIDVSETDSKVCTSQNLYFIVKKLLTDSNDEYGRNIDVLKIKKDLMSLNIREKVHKNVLNYLE